MADDMARDLWELDTQALTEAIAGADPGSRYRESGLEVLQAKTLIAMERTARWTRWLAVATVVLAVATVATAVIALVR